jgi:hypothetical protein
MNIRESRWQRLACTHSGIGEHVGAGWLQRSRGEQASKMTSFSTAESRESKAELFSLPADQMSHIQVVTVGQGPLARVSPPDRRGRVQRLQDHAGDHAGGWAGQPRRGGAG